MIVSIGPWDFVLLVGISIQALMVAYLHSPRHKAAVMTLPIPFTLASMALGRLVDTTHLAGMVTLLVYSHVVRLLHDKFHLPIIPCIALGLLVYIALGMAGARWIPCTPWSFAFMAVVNLSLGAALHFYRHDKPEQGYRSPLPLPVKLPAIMGVVTVLILIKRLLGGFAATFPMVSTVASYEMRHSLRSMCQAVALMLLMVTPFQLACYLTQGRLGLGGGLAVGWVVWALMAACYLPGYLRHREVVATQSTVEATAEAAG